MKNYCRPSLSNLLYFNQLNKCFYRMVNVKTVILTVFLFIICFASKANSNKLPVVVKYGIYIKRITVDFQNSKFHTDFYWWALFKNDSAVSGYSNNNILNFEYVNAINFPIGGFKNEIQLVKELGDNLYYCTGFHQGDFYFSPNFKLYPFDSQKLDIILENSLIPEQELVFMIDSSSYIKSNQDKDFWGLSNDVLSTNQQESYKIYKTQITIGNSLYNSNFGDISLPYESHYGQITTSIYIDRTFWPYLSKLIIPLIIILFLSYFVFYLPVHKIEMSASLNVSALFCATAFQLAISRTLPEVGYIIYVDKIFYTCYALIALSITQSLITFYLDSSGLEIKKYKAHRLDLIFRVIYPFLFVSAIVLFAL